MKKILSLVLLTLFAVAGQAQVMLGVDIYDSDGNRKQGVTIYSFVNAQQAKTAFNRYKESNSGVVKGEYFGPEKFKLYSLADEKDYEAQTVQVTAYLDGALIVDDGEQPYYVPCKKYTKKEGNDYFLQYTIITLKKGEKISQFKDENGERVGRIKEQVISGKTGNIIQRAGSGNQCGHTITWTGYVTLSEDFTRSDARVVIMPYLINTATKDTVLAFNPTVVDGEDYHKTMHRKMGFDHATYEYAGGKEISSETHDKLHGYLHYLSDSISNSGYMKKRIRIPLTLHGGTTQTYINEDDMYNVMGHVTFEDYNTIYYEYNQKLWNGMKKSPKRYLDWSQAKADVDIDTTRYRRTLFSRSFDGSKSYNLEFVVGSAELKNDSVTMQNEAKLVKHLDSFTGFNGGQGAVLTKLRFKVYTSPEGRQVTNTNLSKQRAISISSMLRQNVAKLPRDFSGDWTIIKWEEVADTMEKFPDQRYQDVAKEIRAVCATRKTLDQQWNEIAGKSWWPFVKDSVLNTLRRVEISYTGTFNEIVSAGETYEKFMDGEPGYADCSTLWPYQFYDLMNQLSDRKDWKNLEYVARKAMDNEKCDETAVRMLGTRKVNNDGTITIEDRHYSKKSETRPYPLAAYYLMKCLLHKDTCDLSILFNSPADRKHNIFRYMDYSRGIDGMENQRKGFNGKLAEWWNDEAIVMNTIQMYLNASEFNMASYIANSYLPDDGRYAKFKLLLRAMNCEYSDPDVRDGIAEISPLNAVAMYIVQDEKEYYQKADSILQIDSLFETDDYRIPYLKAICRFHIECSTAAQAEAPHYDGSAIYVEGETGEEAGDWARPIIDAFKANEKNVEYIKHDGFFNDSYRHLALYVWKRMKDGLTLSQAAKDYDEMWNKYGTTSSGTPISGSK